MKVQELLDAWSGGDRAALEQLMPLVFDDLRKIARRCFAGESPTHTLQPTALVNELFLYFDSRKQVDWKSPAHFFGTAAKKIRHLLIDYAEYRHAERRGGRNTDLLFEDQILFSPHLCAEDLLALEAALTELEWLEPRQVQVVELKFFAGMTISEIAEALEIKPTTVKKDWRIARAWLYDKLRGSSDT